MILGAQSITAGSARPMGSACLGSRSDDLGMKPASHWPMKQFAVFVTKNLIFYLNGNERSEQQFTSMSLTNGTWKSVTGSPISCNRN